MWSGCSSTTAAAVAPSPLGFCRGRNLAGVAIVLLIFHGGTPGLSDSAVALIDRKGNELN